MQSFIIWCRKTAHTWHVCHIAFQHTIDQGNVADWPIELLRPSKYNLKTDTMLELAEFCKNTYDTEVHIHPKMDKCGHSVVNDHMYSSEFNSTDRGSFVKAMIVLKENNELHPCILWLYSVFLC